MITYKQWLMAMGRERTTYLTRWSALKHLPHDPTSGQELTRTTIREWLLRWANHSSRMRYSVVCSIRSYLRYLQVVGVKAPRAEDIELPKQGSKLPPQPPAAGEFATFIDNLTGKARLLAELLYGSGLRVSEVVGLNLGDVNLKKGYVRVRSKKRERLVPLTRPTVELLREWLKGRPHPWPLQSPVFPGRRGPRTCRSAILQLLQRRGAAQGLKLTAHIFRHAFALHLLERDCPIHAIQHMLGHALIQTTSVYLQIDHGYMRRVHAQYHPHGDGGQHTQGERVW